MSELQHTLELFGFLSIDDITAGTLKKAFKKKVLEVHPDKGGSPLDFDRILASFVYITETFQRISGGRSTLQDVISPDELRNLRPDELVNRVFEEIDNEKFNARFEEHHKRETHGYQDWIKNSEEDTNVTTGKYGTATQKLPKFLAKDLNSMFITATKKDKPEPSAIILHPEAMAYSSGFGTEIIQTTCNYTSQTYSNPEYADVYSAFTSDNTICDKITTFVESNKTVDDVIKERNSKITPFDNKELQAIQAFEKAKLDKDINNLSKIKEHFLYEETQEKQGKELNFSLEYKGFIHNL